MRRFLLIGMLTVQACIHAPTQEARTEELTDTTQVPAVIGDSTGSDAPDDYPHDPTTDSAKISGDFNGDGKQEYAWAVISKVGHGNPMENGVPDELSLQFSDPSIPAFTIGCCEVRLINEGDLNHDGADEISAFQAPMNGNTYDWTTYTFKDNAWKPLFDSFLIPTGGDAVADEELENRVFMENDSVFYYVTDYYDEGFKLMKKPVQVRQ